jgi:hypothetical protein
MLKCPSQKHNGCPDSLTNGPISVLCKRCTFRPRWMRSTSRLAFLLVFSGRLKKSD